MTPMSQQAQKLDEFRELLGRYFSPSEAYKKFSWVKFQLGQGDDTYLNDMLKQLRMRDSIHGSSPI
jgi:hypothetical protein